MSQQNFSKFIIIDDDNINNFLVQRALTEINKNVQINCFSKPELAIEYLVALKNESFRDLIIFLDINMPVLNGWDVLDKLTSHFSGNLPENAKLYVLSSSDTEKDIAKTKSYAAVNGYLTKPLTLETIKGII